MKSKIIIEINTKFKPLFKYEEEICNSKKHKVTKELEKGFHNFIYKLVEELATELDEDNLDRFMDNSDVYFEGFDSFLDYGKVKIDITQRFKLKEQEK